MRYRRLDTSAKLSASQAHHGPQATTLPELLARLKQMEYRAAIIGPEGSGKTTLLEELQTQLAGQGFSVESVFVNDTTPLTKARRAELIAGLKGDTIVFLDGADRLSAVSWRRLKSDILRVGEGLVITSHKSGMLPTLVSCRTSAELFEQIVSDLLQGQHWAQSPRLTEVFSRHNGNIRDALRELYDIRASQG